MEQDDTQSVDDQAVQWFVLLRDEDATTDVRRAFARWLAADPAHESGVAVGRTDVGWPGCARAGGDQAAAQVAKKQPIKERCRRGPVAGRARHRLANASDGLFADYRTAIGEHRIIVLQDGSQIDLGAASALDVSFSAGERRVRLLTGEAFFTVTKDAARPFVVAAENGEVKVLGTAFDVKIADGVAVAVAHNAVQVSAQVSDHPGAVPDAPVVVNQGQIVRYDLASISTVGAADLDFHPGVAARPTRFPRCPARYRARRTSALPFRSHRSDRRGVGSAKGHCGVRCSQGQLGARHDRRIPVIAHLPGRRLADCHHSKRRCRKNPREQLTTFPDPVVFSIGIAVSWPILCQHFKTRTLGMRYRKAEPERAFRVV